MHEMSIVQSLLSIIQEEMQKNEVSRLIRVTVVHGQMTNIVPDSLHFAFEVLTKETPLEGALLETREEPLVYRCAGCKTEFTPSLADAILAPCPCCDEEFGHEVLSGRELYIESMEAE